jgi:hypothetical protein
MSIPFSISIALLSLAQGVVVALPRAWDPGRLTRLRSGRWALVLPASLIGFVLIASLAERTSANGLTYLALLAVPILAALALGWLTWYGDPPRPARAMLVAPLFALAWADRGGLLGETAALLMTALSCAALGSLLAVLTPRRWLAAGIVGMAVADSALVVADLMQRPNRALNSAHPVAGLPRLQSEMLGSAVMGYGDLFVAGVLGGLLANAIGRAWQLRGAALTVAFALSFDLLFFFVSELPATVPVALTLLAVAVGARPSRSRTEARAGARRRSQPARSRGSAV